MVDLSSFSVELPDPLPATVLKLKQDLDELAAPG